MCVATIVGCTHPRAPLSSSADKVEIDSTVSVDSLFMQGEELLDGADYVAATDHFVQLLELIDTTDLELHSDCLSDLSVCYLRRGLYADAFAAATKVIELDQRLNDKERLVYSYNTLGTIYILNRQPADAEKYLRLSLQMATELNDSVKIAVRNGILSEILISIDKPDEALAAADEALRLDSLRHDTAHFAVRQVQKASVLEELERLPEALALLDSAEPVLRRTGNLNSLAISLNQRGSIALRQERWGDAAEAYDEALAINRRTGNRNGQVKSHLGLWKALRPTDAEHAVDHLEAYSLLRDSLFQEGTLQVMADYDARYELERLRQQNQRQERITRLFIAGAVIFGLLLCIAVLLQMRSIKERNRRVRQWQKKYLAAVAAAEATTDTDVSADTDVPTANDVSAGVEASTGTADNGASLAGTDSVLTVASPPAASPSSAAVDSGVPATDVQTVNGQHAAQPTEAADAPADVARDPFILEIDALLDRQMRSCQVDLAQLAEALCITRTQLNRRVKAIMGVTMQEYANRYRAEHACMLLGQRRLKVAEVARSCGFEDEAYFSRFFRKETGMSPSEFVGRRGNGR